MATVEWGRPLGDARVTVLMPGTLRAEEEMPGAPRPLDLPPRVSVSYRWKKMELMINGEARTLSGVSSVRDLLSVLGIREERVAVEVNRRIIPRKDWEATRVAEQDAIEIVQFVGGG